jgi:hypothetical protein
MSPLRIIAIIALVLAVPIRPLPAQQLARELRPPAGFDIVAVTEDARYVTLQTGTVWEVEISDRATTASWRPNDFVVIRRIWAPRNGYEWLLTKSDNVEQSAAVKLAGRRRPAQE